MTPEPLDPEFVLEHSGHVRALARRLVFDDAAARDLEQETWLAALRNPLEDGSAPRAWLARVAHNAAVRAWRSESRRAHREEASARPEAVPSAEEVLEREEVRAEVVRAVLVLEEPYRSALVLRYLEELPPREAARRLGVPVETLRTRVKRGLERLRAQLRDRHGAGFGAFQLALVRELGIDPPLRSTLKVAAGATLAAGVALFTMQKALAGAAALGALLAALAAWRFAASVAPSLEPAPGGGPAPEFVRASAPEPVEASVEPRAAAGPAAPEDSSGGAGPQAEEVVVLGRVMDELGNPLADAEIVLRKLNGPWRRDAGPTAMYSATSASDGRFRIEAPVPDAGPLRFEARSGLHRTENAREFGRRSAQDLQSGENALGDVVLLPAGAIRGRLRCQGAPARDVQVAGYSQAWGDRGHLYTRSESDGSFVLGRLLPGQVMVDLRGPGVRPASRTLEVVAGATVELGDLDLLPAPWVAGIVVDPSGQPIPGVSIDVRSRTGSDRAWADTDAQGRFRAYVASDGEQVLRVEPRGAWDGWGGAGVADAVVLPGAEDVRIVLQRMPETTFRVVAAEDGRPVERFGLEVALPDGAPGFGPEALREPTVREHPGGETRLPAFPDRHRVLLVAPGFASLQAPVRHDTGDAPVQTLRLERGGTLLGRALLGAAPASGVAVTLQAALVPLGPEPRIPGTIELGHTHRYDLDGFAGRAREVRSGPDGSFRFEDLSEGTYELAVESAGAPTRMDGIRVERGGLVDVGAVELRQGATLRGVLRVGASSPIGWEISLGQRVIARVERADGRFEAQGLPAGEATIRWCRPAAFGLARTDSEEAPERTRTVTLREGEVTDVTIDASASGQAVLGVRVLADGEPQAGVSLFLSIEKPGGGTHGTMRGPTDGEGRWSGEVASGGRVRVSALTRDRLVLATSDWIALAPGETRVVELSAATGELVVEFPEGFEPPSPGVLQVKSGPPDDGPALLVSSDRYRDPPIHVDSQGSWSSRRTVVGRAGVGELALAVWAFRFVPNPGGGWRNDFLFPPVQRTVTIRAGETTVVRVP